MKRFDIFHNFFLFKFFYLKSNTGGGPPRRPREDHHRYKIPKYSDRDQGLPERDQGSDHPRPSGNWETRGREKRGGGNGGRGGATKRHKRGGGGPPSASTGSQDKTNRSDGPPKDQRRSSEFYSPSSFTDAWKNAFFSPIAILLVTTIGLVIEDLPYLHGLAIGGRLAQCVAAWKLVTNNTWIVNVVRFGYKMPLKREPYQKTEPSNPTVNLDAHAVLVTEAAGLLSKGAIAARDPCPGQFISSYFAVPKPRSSKWRPILNLKFFNKNLRHFKFRMETFSQVRDWLQPNAFLVGIDLKDQFLSVPINKKFRKYLRFTWLGQLYEWLVLPFRLKCSPRVVTKMLKPVIAYLRQTLNINISIHMDDMILQAKTAEQAYLDAQITILVLLSLGWEVNWEKTHLVPSHKLTHLGFEIDTTSMTATCPAVKVERLRDFAKSALSSGFLTVHDTEKLIGTMESVRPVTPFAALHYRGIQKQLLLGKHPHRNPKQIITFSVKSTADLIWWVSDTGFLSNCTASLREPPPTLHVWSDACPEAGGAHSSRGEYIQRSWTVEELESSPHINLLELRACKEAAFNFAQMGDRVRLHIDSKVACAYIRKQGGTRSDLLSEEASKLWEEMEARQVTLLTPHWISTSNNTGADFLSRHKLDTWEIKLAEDLFTMVLTHFQVTPTLDAFASRLTRQLDRYMSWEEDKEAVSRDALLSPWDEVTWLFPPVPLIPKVVQKVKKEGITAILICPFWPTSLWWLLVQELMVAPPLPLPPYKLSTRNMTGGPVKVYLDPLQALLISGRS